MMSRFSHPFILPLAIVACAAGVSLALVDADATPQEADATATVAGEDDVHAASDSIRWKALSFDPDDPDFVFYKVTADFPAFAQQGNLLQNLQALTGVGFYTELRQDLGGAIGDNPVLARILPVDGLRIGEDFSTVQAMPVDAVVRLPKPTGTVTKTLAILATNAPFFTAASELYEFKNPGTVKVPTSFSISVTSPQGGRMKVTNTGSHGASMIVQILKSANDPVAVNDSKFGHLYDQLVFFLGDGHGNRTHLVSGDCLDGSRFQVARKELADITYRDGSGPRYGEIFDTPAPKQGQGFYLYSTHTPDAAVELLVGVVANGEFPEALHSFPVQVVDRNESPGFVLSVASSGQNFGKSVTITNAGTGLISAPNLVINERTSSTADPEWKMVNYNGFANYMVASVNNSHAVYLAPPRFNRCPPCDKSLLSQILSPPVDDLLLTTPGFPWTAKMSLSGITSDSALRVDKLELSPVGDFSDWEVDLGLFDSMGRGATYTAGD